MPLKERFIDADIFDADNMGIRNLSYLIHQQERVAVGQELHNLVGIKDNLGLFACWTRQGFGVVLEVCTKGSRKGNVGLMSGFVCHDMTLDSLAYQTKVPDHVQKFMPGGFVIKVQMLVVQDSRRLKL